MAVSRGKGECEAASVDVWEESYKWVGPRKKCAEYYPCAEFRDERNGYSDDGKVQGGNRDSAKVDPCQQLELQKSDAMKETWDFLFPQRRVRVLLVEDDNTTRHIVRVLLQNFNYEVTAATNGLEAWNVMDSASHPFDLVLTDVAMPILSGIDLLDRIMGSEVHGNTPVIMMSSHDSIDIVLKCLRSGAKDFLVKPLRKNEIKHLWQHAWRKHHKEGLHGDMDTCQLVLHDNFNAEEYCKQICNDVYTNSQEISMESGAKGVDLLGSIAYQPRQRTDDWEAIIEENQAIYTAGRTKQSNLKSFSSDKIHISLLELALQRPYPAHENLYKGDGRGGLRQSSSSAFSRYNGSTVHQRQQNSTSCHSVSDQHLLHGGFNMESSYTGEWAGTTTTGLTAPAISCDRVGFNRPSVSSSLHVSHPSVFDNATSVVNSSLLIMAPGGDKDGKGLVQQPTSLGLGRPTPDGCTSTGFSPQNEQTYGKGHKGRSSMQTYPQYVSFPAASPWRTREHCTIDTEVCPGCDHDHDNHFQRSYHDYHGQVKSPLATAASSNQDQESISESRIGTPLYVSSDNEILPNEKERDMGNSRLTGNATYRFKGSASGSNQGSNESDAFTRHSSTLGFAITDSPPLSTESVDNGTNTEERSAVRKHGGAVSGCGEVKDSAMAADEVRNTLREAAIHKFRQKRKFRCFEKKVRYQSRKKLAEERPRVKGQFVRQGGACDDGGRSDAVE